MFGLPFVAKKNSQKEEEAKIYVLLGKFYGSFFSDTFNELNIGKYRQLRDAIGLVRRKFEAHDHPLAYTAKLVMYIQARVALKHLPLTKEQEKYMCQTADGYQKRKFILPLHRPDRQRQAI